jgi:hypothetical protein
VISAPLLLVTNSSPGLHLSGVPKTTVFSIRILGSTGIGTLVGDSVGEAELGVALSLGMELGVLLGKALSVGKVLGAILGEELEVGRALGA